MEPGKFAPAHVGEDELYHVVTVPVDGSPTKVFVFRDDEEGREALAAHCTGENVLRVIFGRERPISESHLVQFDTSRGRVRHSQPII